MSRGFVKESDQEEAPFVPPRAVLPEGATNYVTPRGLTLLHQERTDLEAERSSLTDHDEDDEARRRHGVLTTQLLQLEARIASARLVEPEDVTTDEVRFGARVRYTPLPKSARAKALEITVVGVDEANLKERRVSYLSPLAQAMLGKRVGEEVTLELGAERRRFEVVALSYT